MVSLVILFIVHWLKILKWPDMLFPDFNPSVNILNWCIFFPFCSQRKGEDFPKNRHPRKYIHVVYLNVQLRLQMAYHLVHFSRTLIQNSACTLVELNRSVNNKRKSWTSAKWNLENTVAFLSLILLYVHSWIVTELEHFLNRLLTSMLLYNLLCS